LQQLEPFHLLVDQNSQVEDNVLLAIVGNKKKVLMEKKEMHLKLCYNEATDLQYEILATRCLP
jgi:hypothetical protein